jgi:hypothetical protein
MDIRLIHVLAWAISYAALHAVENSALLPTPRHVARGGVLSALITALYMINGPA